MVGRFSDEGRSIFLPINDGRTLFSQIPRFRVFLRRIIEKFLGKSVFWWKDFKHEKNGINVEKLRGRWFLRSHTNFIL